MPKTSYQEASLIPQTMELGATMGLSETLSWVQSDKFIPQFANFIKEYPRGSDGFRKASTVCSFLNR